VLTDQAPCYLKRLGFPDTFGESGDDEAIFSKFGINIENIFEAAKNMAKS
jgi:transketolase C-terminal domain/subunit